MVKKVDKMHSSYSSEPATPRPAGELTQTSALLQVLALGAVEIEQGKFRSAVDVFEDLEKNDE